jgi:hypothetical protein
MIALGKTGLLDEIGEDNLTHNLEAAVARTREAIALRTTGSHAASKGANAGSGELAPLERESDLNGHQVGAREAWR